MLKERIDDEAFLHLISKWLNAGILDTDGQVLHTVTGTPQGGVVSPVLANIYLHYALDLWFERKVKPHCCGDALIVRFADDFVCAFRYRSDAEAFYQALSERLGTFGLQVAEEKTRIFRFSRFDLKRSGRFDFLGFEFYWDRGRNGRYCLKRRTSRKKLRASVANFTDWIRRSRSQPSGKIFATLRAKYQGYWNYYGVIGNYAGIAQFYYQSKRLLFKWLNRRSQRRSYTWAGLQAALDFFGVPGPQITQVSGPRQLSFL